MSEDRGSKPKRTLCIVKFGWVFDLKEEEEEEDAAAWNERTWKQTQSNGWGHFKLITVQFKEQPYTIATWSVSYIDLVYYQRNVSTVRRSLQSAVACATVIKCIRIFNLHCPPPHIPIANCMPSWQIKFKALINLAHTAACWKIRKRCMRGTHQI